MKWLLRKIIKWDSMKEKKDLDIAEKALKEVLMNPYLISMNKYYNIIEFIFYIK